MLAPEAAYWLRQQGLEELKFRTPLGGSPTSQVTRYTFADGRSVVWKEQPGMSFDYFQAEADGLAAIRSTHTLCVPNVFAGETGLLVEDLKPANPGSAFWQELGRQLAGMHQHEGPHFGFHRDNYIGLSPQTNRKHHDGFEFFAECRLLPQAKHAFDRGLLSGDQVKQVESIAGRLSEWITPQPAVLCHGDLWSGNLMSNADGDPAVIDPSALGVGRCRSCHDPSVRRVLGSLLRRLSRSLATSPRMASGCRCTQSVSPAQSSELVWRDLWPQCSGHTRETQLRSL